MGYDKVFQVFSFEKINTCQSTRLHIYNMSQSYNVKDCNKILFQGRRILMIIRKKYSIAFIIQNEIFIKLNINFFYLNLISVDFCLFYMISINSKSKY